MNFRPLPALALLSGLLNCHALADEPCSGQKLLSKPRPETSCLTVIPQVFVSPEHALHASVLPVDVTLYATPDMESRVVVRSSDGNTLTSADYSSPRGANGFHVLAAKWSPDSQFFVYSLTSSGGHSPWSFPIMVFSRKGRSIATFSDMIGWEPTLSGHFEFAAPNTLMARTWKKAGDLNDKFPVRVDFEKAFARLPPHGRAGGSKRR
jgi:hypothetical protein